MSTSFFVKNGFIWWKGVVEDRQDPIFGWHTEDKTEMPTKDLPWAMPSLPLDNGRNPVGPKEGDWCWGFFLDDSTAQKPVVVGYLPGIDEDAAKPEIGFYDPTPDAELTPENVPRPPRMSPIADYEQEYLESQTDALDPDILPGTNVAFGQLTKEYSADKYKFDLNQDGKYDLEDVDKMVDETEIFTGEVEVVGEFAAVPISRYPLEDSLNEPSTSRLARNENIAQTIVALKTGELSAGEGAAFDGNALGATEQPPAPFAEPKTAYNAKYPYNHVYESESGHVLEVDDTPGAERLHWYHRSGSFKEIHPNGIEVNKSVNSQYNFANLDHFSGIGYNYNLDAGEAIKLKAGQSLTANSGSDLNLQVGGNLNANVSSNQNFKINGNQNTSIAKNRNTAIAKNSNNRITDSYKMLAKGVYINGQQALHLHSDMQIVITSAANVQIQAPQIDLIGSVTVSGSLAVAGTATLIPSPGSVNPNPAAQNLATALATDSEMKEIEEMEAAESSPKYGYLIPNGTTGDVWKPISDSNGNLVVLSASGTTHELREAIPTEDLEAVVIKHRSISGAITEWEVVRPIHTPGKLIDSPVKVDQFEDNIRFLARFSQPGAKYPKQLFWMNNGVPILILNSGYRHQCEVPYDNKIDFNLLTVRKDETESE
jgi:hypothetical protein